MSVPGTTTASWEVVQDFAPDRPRSLLIMGTLKQLRHRRIVQIVLGYAAAGWIVLEASNQFVERGVLPEFVYPLVLTWYLVGFPATAIIGWYHGEKGAQKAPALEVLLLSALGLLAVGLSLPRVLAYLDRQAVLEAAAQSRMNLQRVAVRYFDDLSTDGELRYLADGLTEDLIAELEGVRALDIVSRNGVEPFRGLEVPPDSVARALEAGTIVDGSVRPTGDDVRINVRLIDGESGAEIRRTAFERPMDDLLQVRDAVAEEVSHLLRDWLGEEVELRSRRAKTESTTAWALVQRAERARKEMEAAIEAGDRERLEATYGRAQGLLEQAETLDADWPVPTIMRGWLDYRRSRVAGDLHGVVEWVEHGQEHAERALAQSPDDAEALELRGTLYYWRWLLNVTADPDEQAALLQRARNDLERAVDLDPTLASAYSTLSHLYAQSDVPAMILAARRAYEEDAYLDVAERNLWYLFTGSLDMGQFTQARRWCEEGARRFPENPRFVVCGLRLMATPAQDANVERGWELLARYDSLMGGGHSPAQQIRARLTMAGILARAGLEDSARAVIERARSRIEPGTDPSEDLASWEAYIRSLLGDHDEAIALLKRYQAAHPGHTFNPSEDLGWWWRELASHPDFEDLAGDH